MLPISFPACRSNATVRARQHHSVRVLQPSRHPLPQLLRGAGGVPRGGGRGHVARGGHVVNTDVVLLYKCYNITVTLGTRVLRGARVTAPCVARLWAGSGHVIKLGHVIHVLSTPGWDCGLDGWRTGRTPSWAPWPTCRSCYTVWAETLLCIAPILPIV